MKIMNDKEKEFFLRLAGWNVIQYTEYIKFFFPPNNIRVYDIITDISQAYEIQVKYHNE